MDSEGISAARGAQEKMQEGEHLGKYKCTKQKKVDEVLIGLS